VASRRRHTRLVSDWSSDVCSSDLCFASRHRRPVNSSLHATFTVEENVAWRLEFTGLRWRDAKHRAAGALDEVGIDRTARQRLPRSEERRVGKEGGAWVEREQGK